MINPKQLSTIRKNLNLTQSELSKLSGVSQSLIAKIEKNNVDPSFSSMEKLTNALDFIEKKDSKKAKDYMTKKIISTKPNDTIENVIKIMKKHSLSQIVVLDYHVIGLITENSIIESISKKNLKYAKDIMISSPPIIEIDTPRKIILELLKHYQLIVVKDKEVLKGVITKSNLLELIRN